MGAGSFSVALGHENNTSEDYSFAMGINNTASGKDDYGDIGNDTTVSPLDLLGVAYSGIKELEKRTEILQAQNEKMNQEIAAFTMMKLEMKALQAAVEAIKQKSHL